MNSCLSFHHIDGNGDQLIIGVADAILLIIVGLKLAADHNRLSFLDSTLSQTAEEYNSRKIFSVFIRFEIDFSWF